MGIYCGESVDESLDDDVGVLNELAVVLVLVLEIGARVDEAVDNVDCNHLINVNREKVKILRSKKLVLHGFLDAEVKLDGGDDGACEGEKTGDDGDVTLGEVCLQPDGNDGVESGEDDEGDLKVLGISLVLEVAFLVVGAEMDAVFADSVKDVD